MPITKSYILDEEDVEIIEKKSQEMGDSSVSAALRTIIREWAELKQAAHRARVPSASTYPAIPFGG